MNALLTRLGVQVRPFRALVRTFATMDLRGQLYGLSTGAKAGELIPPLFWVYGQMLTVSLLLCAALAGRVDARFYAFANLSVAALMVFSAVVVEFHEAAYDPEDVRVIGHRPVTSRTWSLARFVNLLGYVALVGVAVTIFPTVMGLGLRDTDPTWLLRYPIASVMTCICSASVALGLYVMGGFGERFDGLRQALAWTQIGGILALFYGAQFMIRNGTGSVSMMSYDPPEWVLNSPIWHLAPWVSDGAVMPVAVAAAATVGAGGLALWGMQRAWSGVATVQAVTATLIRPVSSPAWLSLLGLNRRGRALFSLTRALFGRDRELRSRTWPALGMAVTVPIIGILAGEYSSPTVGFSGAAVVPIGSVVVLCGAIPSLLFNLMHSRDHIASFRLAPFWDGDARHGVGTAVYLSYCLPLLVLHGLVLTWFWGDVISALRFSGTAAVLVALVARVCVTSQLQGPIASRSWRRGGSGGSVTVVIAGVSALAGTLGGLWLLSSSSLVLSAVFVVALLAGLVAAVVVDRPKRATA
jgi:hypothetical protein